MRTTYEKKCSCWFWTRSIQTRSRVSHLVSQGGDGICSVQPVTSHWVFPQRRLPTGRESCKRSFSSTTIVRTMTAKMTTGTGRLKRCSKRRVRKYLLNLLLVEVRKGMSPMIYCSARKTKKI